MIGKYSPCSPAQIGVTVLHYPCNRYHACAIKQKNLLAATQSPWVTSGKAMERVVGSEG